MIIASGLARKLAIFRQSSVGFFSLVISCCYCHVARPFLSSLVSLRLPCDDPLLSATTNYICVYTTHTHTHHTHHALTHTYIYLYISTLLACFFIGIAFRKWFGAYVKYYTLSTHILSHTHTHTHIQTRLMHTLWGSLAANFPCTSRIVVVVIIFDAILLTRIEQRQRLKGYFNFL